MKNYKMIIQYDGTRYAGWQRQDSNSNTIQGKLEVLLSKMEEGKVTINGSGRTDAGVHANGQVINVQLATKKSTAMIKEYMNSYLPEDIYVVKVVEVDPRFHARLSAKGKKYVYCIVNHEDPDLFQRHYTHHIIEPLDCIKMAKAMTYLEGTHDFASFTSKKNKKKSTIRTIKSIELKQCGKELQFIFSGDGFLYHMIRIIMGTLIEIGLGQRSPEEVQSILEGKERAKAGHLAPAKGLRLESVYYNKE
ncbi:MAG: tRNA pseudouridine(38-40) synthase TruA [Eubacteriales bacterium]